MLLANTGTQWGLRASPGARANCPECEATVIAKCGPIMPWHWAHLSLGNCANQGETAWHLDWKVYALEGGCQVEQKLVDGFRADVVTPAGRVIELQSKALDLDTADDREQAYQGRLTWLVKVENEDERIVWGKELRNGGHGFRWRNGPKRLAYCRAPICLDLVDSGRLFMLGKLSLVKSYYSEAERLVGWGRFTKAASLFEVRSSHQFCSKHRTFFCPCVMPMLYNEQEAALWA